MNTLHTEHLILRPFRNGDAEAMFRNWTQDERVARYCRWHPHKDISETESFLQFCIGAEYSWAITLKGKDEPIGGIDVVGENDMGVPEIGYVLAHEYWGKGLMTEAVQAVLDELFRRGFEKIGACHDINNPASGKVMEKCGMTYVRNSMALKNISLMRSEANFAAQYNSNGVNYYCDTSRFDKTDDKKYAIFKFITGNREDISFLMLIDVESFI